MERASCKISVVESDSEDWPERGRDEGRAPKAWEHHEDAPNQGIRGKDPWVKGRRSEFLKSR